MMAINELSDRQAMQLPAHCQPSILQDLEPFYAAYRQYPAGQLITITESKQHTIQQRYCAGQLLGLLGDPRLDTYNPTQILIPAGTAQIGTDANKIPGLVKQFSHLHLQADWFLKESPPFRVTVNAFKINKYPVTNQEYYHFLQDTHYTELPSIWPFGVYPHAYSNHPVHSISAAAADAYANWLAKKTQRHFRLPSEIEWEYAARGTHYHEYPWGTDYQEDHANTVEQQLFQSTPVGMFPKGASQQGVMDMAGNVEEYVACDYRPYPGGEWVADDLTKHSSSYRIARGGSYTRHHDLARCARRHGQYSKSIYVMGVRLVEAK
ncbi:MAG: SUMF1/EgtB/PvdO family nonheme iron enzyme [Coxiellaceae bacterium]|nr:SUMF1/EgtB/PvdO family nonheme iron enzyme [Coxiellaceae bacterium]